MAANRSVSQKIMWMLMYDCKHECRAWICLNDELGGPGMHMASTVNGVQLGFFWTGYKIYYLDSKKESKYFQNILN